MLKSLADFTARALAVLVVRPIVRAYEDIYTDDGDDGPDSGPLRYDPRSTTAADTSVASNLDHNTPESFAMGFGKPIRRIR